MSPLFPNHDTLRQTFGGSYTQGGGRSQAPSHTTKIPTATAARTPYEARLELYPAYSIIDDAKNKASKLSAEAAKDFEAASQKAQAKAGKIELFSGKYYAACTFGGLMACVSTFPHPYLPR